MPVPKNPSVPTVCGVHSCPGYLLALFLPASLSLALSLSLLMPLFFWDSVMEYGSDLNLSHNASQVTLKVARVFHGPKMWFLDPDKGYHPACFTTEVCIHLCQPKGPILSGARQGCRAGSNGADELEMRLMCRMCLSQACGCDDHISTLHISSVTLPEIVQGRRLFINLKIPEVNRRLDHSFVGGVLVAGRRGRG